MRIKNTCQIFGMLTLSTVTSHASITIFDADFQGAAAATDNLKDAVDSTARNTILDAGTSVGSWADNGTAPSKLYEIADDEEGNHVLVISHGASNLTFATANFSETANLSTNSLSLSWDWMITDENGGGTSSRFIDVMDSSSAKLFTVEWKEGGNLLIDGTNVGPFNNVLGGYTSTNLTSSNWNPLSLELTVTDSSISVTANNTFLTAINGSYTDASALRLRGSSNKSWSEGGMWIDDINASYVSAVPEPSSTALLSLGGLALILRRRK